MTFAGLDVSENQPPNIPLIEWFAGGVTVLVVRASIGFREDSAYEQFVIHAAEIGYLVGAYHALLGHQYYDPTRQAADFVGLLMPQIRFAVLDIEAPGSTAADVAAWCNYFDAHSQLPLLLYGNMQLETLLGVHPARFAGYGLWVADYGRGTPTRVPLAAPHIPRVGKFRGHQFAGDNGERPPYQGPIDLTNWETLPTEGVETMPVTLTDAQVKQFAAVLDDLVLHLSQIKTQAVAWQTYAQAEADYILTLRPLLVITAPPPPVKHTLATLTNNQVFTLFQTAFGAPYFTVVTRACDETYMLAHRTDKYIGPAIEDMPTLTAAERSALVNALGLPVG